MRLRRPWWISWRKDVPLEGGGERVDINLANGVPDYDSFDMYEKSHWRRYEFALEKLVGGGTSGDFACGTGYGSVLLAQRSSKVVGADLDGRVVAAASRRYRHVPNVSFLRRNLLDLNHKNTFDTIVSFETVEHFSPDEIPRLFATFASASKPGAMLILSTPYLQPASPEALSMGFHQTFSIDEERVETWFRDAGYSVHEFLCQNYETHDIVADMPVGRDFIIAVGQLQDA
jgi:cyclopropane fatty-acyl-phospholipid synthase-like methyltransferase